MLKASKKLEDSPRPKLVRKLKSRIGEKLSQPVDVFAGMQQLEDETVEKIVVSMLNPENVEMKTRVGVPLALSRMELMGTWYEIEGFPDAKKVVDAFCKFLRVNEVSLDGKSREEIVRILSEAMKQERSLQDKLTAPPSD